MQIVLSEQPPSAFPEAVAELVWLPRIYITRPERFRARSVRVINLSRDCEYLGTGYYASLLAEARGHKVIPSVQTILDLGRRSLYRFALPELNAILAKSLSKLTEPVRESVSLLIAFGNVADGRFRSFTRAVFDRFRHPLLRLVIAPARDGGCVVKSVEPLSPADLTPDETAWFYRELAAHLKVPWRAKRTQPVPGYSIAMLHDPEEGLPPSRQPTLDKFVRVGAQMGIEVEPIRKQDLHRLAEFDGLFIRETTAITNHTYRFARRAEREGLAVIDDPTSIVRCTNKVYLAELLAANGVPTPSTVVLDRRHLKAVGAKLAFPLVLKVPDGSFSRGVFKVYDEAELHRRASELLEDSDLILAQEYVPTQFDWRVGVLNRDAALCLSVLHVQEPLADREARSGRPVRGGHVQDACGRAGAARGGRSRPARGRTDRRRPLWRGHQADRTGAGRDRDQRQPESRGRHRGRGAQGRALSPRAR